MAIYAFSVLGTEIVTERLVSCFWIAELLRLVGDLYNARRIFSAPEPWLERGANVKAAEFR